MNTATASGLATLTTAELTELFERGALPDTPFTHRDHVRVAWELLARYDLGTAIQAMTGGIRRLAESREMPNLYHATITTFYMLAVAEARSTHPPATSFSSFEGAHPELFSDCRGFLLGFYTPGTLDSTGARLAFRLPDRWRVRA